MRILPTPFATPDALPSQASPGFSAGVRPALIEGPGQSTARARLADPHLLVVTTGQQPALFTGPLYTVHKALSAAALARVLSARWGRPVAPLFWVASDDHDFAEANHAAWLRPDGSLRLETLPDRPESASLRPMSKEPLGSGIERMLEAIAADMHPFEGHAETLLWLRTHFRADATMASAGGGALAELLAPFGVLCVDGGHPALKTSAAPIIRRALEDAVGLEAALVERSAALVAEGRDPGVVVGDGATLVMLEGPQGRDRLIRDGEGFATRHGGEHFSRNALLDLLDREPARFSANVLLRPIVERSLFPTVAYVAGPGEMKYLALAEVAFRYLDVTPPTPVPRWSGLLVEPRVDRVLGKFGATLEELLAPGALLEGRVARSHVPPAALESLAALRSVLAAEYGRLEAAASEVDPTLLRPIGGLRVRALDGTDRAEKKLIRHLKRRHETEITQIERARTAVQPSGKPQERLLTVAPYLARYGHGILERLLEAMVNWYSAALEGGATPS